MIDVILKYLDPNPKTEDFINEMVVFLQKQENTRFNSTGIIRLQGVILRSRISSRNVR